MEPSSATPPAPKLSFDEWKRKADEAIRAKKASGSVLPPDLQEMLAVSTVAQYESWLRRKNTIDVATEVCLAVMKACKPVL
jgi:hypothetical protein